MTGIFIQVESARCSFKDYEVSLGDAIHYTRLVRASLRDALKNGTLEKELEEARISKSIFNDVKNQLEKTNTDNHSSFEGLIRSCVSKGRDGLPDWLIFLSKIEDFENKISSTSKSLGAETKVFADKGVLYFQGNGKSVIGFILKEYENLLKAHDLIKTRLEENKDEEIFIVLPPLLPREFKFEEAFSLAFYWLINNYSSNKIQNISVLVGDCNFKITEENSTAIAQESLTSLGFNLYDNGEDSSEAWVLLFRTVWEWGDHFPETFPWFGKDIFTVFPCSIFRQANITIYFSAAREMMKKTRRKALADKKNSALKQEVKSIKAGKIL